MNDERARGVAVDDEVAEPEERLLLDGAEELQDRLHGDRPARLPPRAGRASRRRRGSDPRALRAISESAASGTSIPSPSATRRRSFDELGEPRPREDERLAARAHRRQHLRELGRAEDEDEVGRGLLDQLQQRVPGGVGELVRLVEDVDLVAPLDRLEHDALADLADVVDPALRRGVHLDDVERGAVRDRDAGVGTSCPATTSGPAPQFSALARIRAIDVFPVPRGPAKRYACRTWSLVDRVPKRADDRLLAHDLVEVLRAVLAVERGHPATQSAGATRLHEMPGSRTFRFESGFTGAVPAPLARARLIRGT